MAMMTSRLRKRALASAAILAVVGSLSAQQTPATGQPAPQNNSNATTDQAITMSPFSVSSTEGKGYISNDAITGMKSNTLLIDIPQSVEVIPRDVIDDLGQFAATVDTLKFVSAGTVPFARTGEMQMQRGFRTGYALIDGQLDLSVASDPMSYDSFEVVKGPAAVLYGNHTSLGGIIVKITRKPLPVRRDSVRLILGSQGMRRGEIDSTGPLGSIGSTKVSYRLYGAYQKYDGFGPVDFDNHKVIGGGLKFDLSSNTTLLLQMDVYYNENRGIYNGFANATNTGMYFGPGYSQGYKAKWSRQKLNRYWYKATLDHSFSENWHFTSTLSYNDFHRKDRETRNSAAPNYVTNTIQQYDFGWNYKENLVSLETDVTGTYRLAGFKNQSTFGFEVDRDYGINNYWFIRNLAPTSITDPQIYNSPMPVYDASNATPANESDYYSSYAYFMQTFEIVPDKLTAVAGVSGSYTDGNNKSYATNATTVSRAHGTPRRIGLVYKPIKGLALYANDSTTYQGTGSTNPDGSKLPPIVGEVKEVGLKTALFGGRISSTISYFDLNVTNIPIPDPNTGMSKAAGKQTNKGFEADIAIRPLENWTVMGTVYQGDIKDVNGQRMPNTVNSTWSLVTRYDFGTGPLQGFGIGGSMFHQGDRSGGPWNPYTIANLFLTYVHRSWSVSVNIDNIADKQYSGSGWGPFYMDPGPRRSTQFTFAYRF